MTFDPSKLTEEQKKRFLKAQESPLSMPRPAPKAEPKKRGRKPKDDSESDEN